jgi:molecular chaperone HscB
MNHFELFEIPVTLQVNAALMKQKFYELSRKYHPDFFTQENENDQSDALEKSSQVNKAFRIFSKQDETIKYVLQLKGLLEDDEKYQLPPNFLLEVMDMNEQLMEAKMESDKHAISKIKSALTQLQIEIYEPIKSIIENYKEGITTNEELLQVKEYYFKKKYLNRILEGMS